MKYQPYRDEPYQRECEDRYEPIHEFCSHYKRRFSVLDIGANYGWFGQRLVKDFPNCVYVGVDNKTIDPHERIWHIPRHITERELCDLSRSEQFDVVLGLSVLHHFKDYSAAYHAMTRLGEFGFFEIPGKDDTGALAPERHEGIRAIFDAIGEAEYSFKSHVSDCMRPMYIMKSTPFLLEQSMDAASRGAPGYAKYSLHQDFAQAIIEIDRTPMNPVKEIRTFIPGINLHNFKLLGGQVEVPEANGHPDYKPWNYVLSDGPYPIDYVHKKT
jgi:SAM-dependent methyltransferase